MLYIYAHTCIFLLLLSISVDSNNVCVCVGVCNYVEPEVRTYVQIPTPTHFNAHTGSYVLTMSLYVCVYVSVIAYV